MCIDAVKDLGWMYSLPLLARFPGFLSPSAIRNTGGGRAPTSCLSAGSCIELKAREIWLRLHTSVCKCVCVRCAHACLSQTSAPNSMTPVSIMGTSLSSTCTSRMVLSIWERLAGSRLQGTHRWITCRGQQRRQLYERKQPIKFMKLLFQVGHRRCCEQKKIGQEIQTRQKRSESERVFFVWADKHQKKIIFTYPKVQNK